MQNSDLPKSGLKTKGIRVVIGKVKEDIRWVQRLDNYQKALIKLCAAVQLMSQRELSDLEKQGVIQSFEYTYELGWNLLKDYLEWQGIENIVGSRDTIRESFKRELISDGHIWMSMLQDGNRSVHTYNEETAEAILENIKQKYYNAFEELRIRFQSLKSYEE